MKAVHSNLREAGFSRSDAMAAFGTLALLVGLLLSVAGGTRATSENVFCRANLRHLGQAWQAYALDHSGRVIGSPNDGSVTLAAVGEFWAGGSVSWDSATASSNVQAVLTPAFVPYVGRDPQVFRCPADRYLSAAQTARRWSSRMRSYSMNSCFGPRSQDLVTLRQFDRLEDVPDASRYFVLVEEHPDSINDPTFFTTFQGANGWVDVPASHHERACNFLFADAHVETHPWQSARTVIPVRFQFPILSGTAKDPDFRWTYERTSIAGR